MGSNDFTDHRLRNSYQELVFKSTTTRNGNVSQALSYGEPNNG